MVALSLLRTKIEQKRTIFTLYLWTLFFIASRSIFNLFSDDFGVTFRSENAATTKTTKRRPEGTISGRGNCVHQTIVETIVVTIVWGSSGARFLRHLLANIEIFNKKCNIS